VLRRPKGASDELLLTATAQNFRKLTKPIVWFSRRVLAIDWRLRPRVPAGSRRPERHGARTLTREQSSMVRQILLRVLAVSMLTVCATPASHAEYPERPLKIIVAWPPGGVVDTTARVVGDQLAARLG
jgi:hypothetical protein